MNSKKTLLIIYLGISCLTILMIGSTTANLWQVIPGLVFVWFMYFVYCLGYNTSKTSYSPPKSITDNLEFPFITKMLQHRLLVLIICFICSIAVTKYYTGQTLVTLTQNLLQQKSLYAMYQAHFAANNISSFSIAKIPFVLMNYILNILVLLSFINLIIISKKIDFKSVIYLILLSVSYLQYGLARGTNFELFLWVFLLIHCFRYRIHYHKISVRLSRKIKIIILILAVSVFLVFQYSVGIRYKSFGYTISREIQFDPNEIIPSISQDIGLIVCKLSQYFGFGLFYTSAFFRHVLFDSIKNMICYLFPFASTVLGYTPSTLVNQHIDQSSNWVPDIVGWFGKYGLFLTTLFIFLIGYVSKICTNKKDIIHIALYHLLLLQMFSLPIGNFVVVSSANRLILITLIGLLIWKKFSR